MKKTPKYYTVDELRKKWMKNPGFRREYEKLQPHFEIASKIIEARIKRKISQEELARRMGTGQAVISRLESANARPSLSLMQRLADALGLKLEIRLIPR